MSKAENNKNGLVLVAVLWMIVLLMVIVASVGRGTRLDTRLCRLGGDELRCKWAARAGIDTAIAVLNEDTKESDSLNDLWNDNEEDFNEVELDKCRFTVRVVDESGKLNINTATKEQFLGLPDMTEDVVDAIIDWRDKDEMPEPSGAEGGYYENLRYRYKIRNGRFRTIREMLLLKDFPAVLFYGEDTNFNGRLDYNERDGDETLPADDGNDELDIGWIEYLTCYSCCENKDAGGKNRVDINKADEKELIKKLDIKKSYAKWIVENRPKNKYKSIADLINDKSPEKAKKSSEKDSDKAEALDLETFSGIADKITVSDKKKLWGRVNINTAPKNVLSALLGGDDSAERIAHEVIAYREGLTTGMESIADVMKVKSVDVNTFKKIAEHITTRSDVFVIRSFAVADGGAAAGTSMQAEVVVDRSSRPCRMLYRYQGTGN